MKKLLLVIVAVIIATGVGTVLYNQHKEETRKIIELEIPDGITLDTALVLFGKPIKQDSTKAGLPKLYYKRDYYGKKFNILFFDKDTGILNTKGVETMYSKEEKSKKFTDFYKQIKSHNDFKVIEDYDTLKVAQRYWGSKWFWIVMDKNSIMNIVGF